MKFLKYFYRTVVVVLISVALFLAASALPIENNFQVKVVNSGSMGKAIPMGGIVIIKPATSYKTGDVITFEGGRKEPITHRIVETEAIEGMLVYTTKGDANETPDQNKVNHKSVIGKVLFRLPYLGYVVNAAKKPVGFMVIVVAPALIIVFDEMRKIGKEITKMRDKKRKANNENKQDA